MFDGYDEGPSIKDNTHQRRGNNKHQIVSLTAETEFSGKKEDVLSCEKSKTEIIGLMSTALIKRGCHVIQSSGDADVDIAKATVERSRVCTTTLVGEDTDLLILLLHYSRTVNKDVYFRSDVRKQSKEDKFVNITQLKRRLGDEMCTELLFCHAYTGCDSTSRIFGIGKKLAFQKLIKSEPVIKSCAREFTLQNKSQHEISELGNKMMVDLFGGAPNENLSSLRDVMFSRKVATAKSFVSPERLPPTAAATNFHSLRTYFQIMLWMGLATDLNPTHWGWKEESNRLVPVMTEKNAAPDELLKVIHCNCSTGCRSSKCSCRRYDLPCILACGICQTENCENINTTPQGIDIDDENVIQSTTL